MLRAELQTLAGAGAQSLTTGTHFDAGQVLSDNLGSVIGNAVVSGMVSPHYLDEYTKTIDELSIDGLLSDYQKSEQEFNTYREQQLIEEERSVPVQSYGGYNSEYCAIPVEDNNYSPIPEGFYDKTPLTQIRDAAGKIWEDYGDEILRYGPKALGVWGSRSPALETDTSLTTSDYLKMAGSFALDCIPIVGQLKAAEQVWSGKEMLTEARMHRGLAALGLLPGGKLAYTAFKALGKTGSKLGVLGSKTSVVEEIVQTVPNRVSDLESIAARRVYLNEKFGRTGDLNYDIAFRGYMEKVDTLNVASKPGEAVFYSGWNPSGISNRELGEAFARSKGWTTLEQTTGGKWLDQEKLYGSSKQGDFLKPVDADKVWARLSQNYAMGVEKSVTAFVNGANSNRVFYQYEYPILMNRGIKIKFMN